MKFVGAVLSLALLLSPAALLTVRAQELPNIPTIPSVYPDPTQLYVINDTFLQQPIVTTAMEYVRRKVSPSLLAVQPSTYVQFGNVTYPPSQVTTYCKWGNGPTCTRKEDTADFKADILYCPQPNAWGITYDDGPNGNTPGTAELRTALKEANIKATFFVLGSAARLFPTMLKAAYDEGHEIAIHGWTHRPMTSLTNEQIVAELKYTEAVIYEQIGQVPLLYRPPYGDIDDRVRAIVSALGYRLIIWTTIPDEIRDTQDTTSLVQSNQPEALANVTKWFTDPVSNTRGFISLQHDQSNFTANYAIAVVNAFRSAAATSPLKPQPVGTCLGISSYKNSNGTTADATPSTPSGSSGGTSGGSANGSEPKPSGTNAASGAAKGGVRWSGVQWVVAAAAMVFAAMFVGA